jgi:endonuclease/exonuclease/phosphatase family metal-dependent hydrolase
MRVLAFAVLLLVFGGHASAESLRMIAFNIERGYRSDADLATIVDLMDSVGPADIWALSEGSSADAQYFLKHLGPAYYESVRGSVGSDYLLVLYRKRKFIRLDWGEIPLPGIDGRPRKPLWLHLRTRKAGVEFFVVANHLLRGQLGVSDEPRRSQEAEELKRWVRDGRTAIALGDFNFDFRLEYTAEDELASRIQRSNAFAVMTENDWWAWVRPDVLVPTQCDPRFDSVLDFAFVAGRAKNWPREITVLNIGCDDDDKRPDHLPIDLRITVRP